MVVTWNEAKDLSDMCPSPKGQGHTYVLGKSQMHMFQVRNMYTYGTD